DITIKFGGKEDQSAVCEVRVWACRRRGGEIKEMMKEALKEANQRKFKVRIKKGGVGGGALGGGKREGLLGEGKKGSLLGGGKKGGLMKLSKGGAGRGAGRRATRRGREAEEASVQSASVQSLSTMTAATTLAATPPVLTKGSSFLTSQIGPKAFHALTTTLFPTNLKPLAVCGGGKTVVVTPDGGARTLPLGGDEARAGGEGKFLCCYSTTHKKAIVWDLESKSKAREIELAAGLLHFSHYEGGAYTLITEVGCFVWGEEGRERPRAVWRWKEGMKVESVRGYDEHGGVGVVQCKERTWVTDGEGWEELVGVGWAGVVKGEGGFVVGMTGGGKVKIFKKNKGETIVEGDEVDIGEVGEVVGFEVGREKVMILGKARGVVGGWGRKMVFEVNKTFAVEGGAWGGGMDEEAGKIVVGVMEAGGRWDVLGL
ncbi:hypothetical protein TrCOL_g13457, partial [Triparma columacea]